MINLTISRRRWLTIDRRATPVEKLNFDSALRQDRKMCCLGFYARQIVGIKARDLDGLGMPSSTVNGPEDPNIKKWAKLLSEGGDDSRICSQLAAVNDNAVKYTIHQKEVKIKALFKRIGVHVTFKD